LPLFLCEAKQKFKNGRKKLLLKSVNRRNIISHLKESGEAFKKRHVLQKKKNQLKYAFPSPFSLKVL